MLLKIFVTACAFLLGFYVHSQFEWTEQKKITEGPIKPGIVWEDPKPVQLVIYVPREAQETLELFDSVLKFLFLKEENKKI